MILSTLRFRLPPTLIALGASLAVALTATLPQPARADRGGFIAGAIVAGAIVCATNPEVCGGNRRGNAGGGGGGGGDAIALNRDQKMMVQSGLQNLGFYSGAIDGAIGAGTRGSIRSYQTAIGAPATGGLTGVQINDLVALSPRYVRYPLGDVNLFMADIAPDLDRDGVAQLQAALNRAGYDAGPVDGAMGGRTRDAIRLYKINNGLPGPALPTRRLLAHLHGYEAPLPAGIEMASMRPEGFDGGQGYMSGMNAGTGGGSGPATTLNGGGGTVLAPQPAPVTTTQANKGGQGKQAGGAPVVVARSETLAPVAPAPATPVAPMAVDLDFDILGAKLGMTDAALAEVLKVELGADILSGTGTAAQFGGNGVLAAAHQWLQPSWHAAPAEQVVALSDPARPELGTLALIRLVRLPASVDQAIFDQHVLPELLAYYGAIGRVGDSLSWIGNGAAREAAAADPAALAACGDLKVASVPEVANALDGLWSKGGGVTLDPASLDSVSSACGTVVKVSFQPGLLTIGLWNADALNGAAAIPVIKF